MSVDMSLLQTLHIAINIYFSHNYHRESLVQVWM